MIHTVTKTLAVSLLIGSALAFFIRQSELSQLRQENETLQKKVAEANRLAQTNAQLQQIQVDTAALERLRPVTLELARMRAKFPKLRQAAESSPEAIKEKIAALTAATKEKEQRVDLIQQWRETAKMQKAVSSGAYTLVNVYQSVTRYVGAPPKNFQELQSGIEALEANDSLPEDQPRSGLRIHGGQNVLHAHHPHIGSLIEHFEFIPQTGPANSAERPALLFRERKPRPLPDGRWARFYGLFQWDELGPNASVERVVLPENRFDAWERNQRPSPR